MTHLRLAALAKHTQHDGKPSQTACLLTHTHNCLPSSSLPPPLTHTQGKLRCIVVDASNRALRIFDNLQTHGAGNEEHEREYKEAVIKDLQRLIRE